MTPERKAYLAKCGKREAWIRTKMFQAKSEIALCKAILNYRNKVDDISKWKTRLEMWKIEFTAYRHELARLKGMDRVVVPKRILISTWSGIKFSYCKCGKSIKSLEKYCKNCGRRILW